MPQDDAGAQNQCTALGACEGVLRGSWAAWRGVVAWWRGGVVAWWRGGVAAFGAAYRMVVNGLGARSQPWRRTSSTCTDCGRRRFCTTCPAVSMSTWTRTTSARGSECSSIVADCVEPRNCSGGG